MYVRNGQSPVWFVASVALCVAYCAFVTGGARASAQDAASTEEHGSTDHAAPGEHAHTSQSHGHHEDLGHGNAGESFEDASELKTDLAIYTFVVFMLLLAILGKFAWPPIVQALEEREKNIAGHIEAAEAKHEDAKLLLIEHEKKLAGAADEVRELLEEARRDAEHTKSQIIAEAKAAAQAEHERSARELRIATDTAMKRIAETSANLAIDLAGKIVQEKITPEHQSRIVREAIAKLASAEPSAN